MRARRGATRHRILSGRANIFADYTQSAFERAFEPYFQMLLLRDNSVGAFLRRHGYEFVTFSSGMTFSQIAPADRFLRPGNFLTLYQGTLLDMTPLRHFLSQLSSNPPGSKWDPLRKAKQVPYILDKLGSLEQGPEGEPSVRVRACVRPHPPHMFNKNGEHLGMTLSFEEGYIGEALYLNRELLRVTDSIPRRAPNSAIIIQGDHGPWQYGHSRNVRWDGDVSRLIADRVDILNAYYLSGADASQLLYPTISPVNRFRVVFNHYFSANLPLLPDQRVRLERAIDRRKRNLGLESVLHIRRDRVGIEVERDRLGGFVRRIAPILAAGGAPRAGIGLKARAGRRPS